uniref:Uncharacterized protein n=1 Tax=viral metagenome TaxID=1070528 RepID=A0A6M3JG47_9ZZZZ
MVRIVHLENGDYICKDCDGRNWCYCDENQSEPICQCGRLAYECICRQLEDEYESSYIGENDEL